MSSSTAGPRRSTNSVRRGGFVKFALPAGIDFTSNDYLGYAAQPIQSATEPLALRERRRGCFAAIIPIWDEVERTLAEWHGAEAVLMMTSGYTANEGLISTLMEPGDWVASR